MLIDNKKIIFITILVIVSLILPFFENNIYGKYINEQTILVGTINIKKNKPEITLLNIQNSNTDYPEYANKEHTITIQIKVNKAKVKEEFIEWQNLQVNLDGATTNKYTKEINLLTKGGMESIYEIKLKNIEDDGFVSLFFPQNMFRDESGLGNDATKFDLSININNMIKYY